MTPAPSQKATARILLPHPVLGFTWREREIHSQLVAIHAVVAEVRVVAGSSKSSPVLLQGASKAALSEKEPRGHESRPSEAAEALLTAAEEDQISL